LTRYEFLLFVHIACAAIWVGGAFTFQVYGWVVLRQGDARQIAEFAGNAGRIGERLFAPASIVVVLAGIGLMLDGDWPWGRLWVIWALVAFTGTFLTGLLVLGPTAKKLPEVGPTTPEGQAIIRKLFSLLRADLVFLFSIIFAMTVKPTFDDGWTVAIAAILIVALAGWFQYQGRNVRLAEAPPAESAA
jgi:uncharacterized membrane protein